MTLPIAQYYDVVIAGGGPAGAVLGALLARETDLSVAIFESDVFPRQHIGESLTAVVVPLLRRCGALGKILNSGCYVPKYGGYFFWDREIPWVAFFAGLERTEDRHLPPTFHVNRAEFDHLLLDHARSSGCAVFQGVTVTAVHPRQNGSQVLLGNGGQTLCRIFADASGRERKRAAESKTADFLIHHRNIAIWTHVLGGKPAQSLDGHWNVFRKPGLSPIGNFAFEDGWFWYIPVPMTIGGQRRLTHSLGLVTHPAILRQRDKRYTDVHHLLAAARRVPALRDLVGGAEPVYEKTLAAKNYSMISRRIADYDKKRLALGDAAYFVDPLFSTGVSFAMLHATAAAAVIKRTFSSAWPDSLKREAWIDYEETLRQWAQSFALGIEQWYAALARGDRHSVYWRGLPRHTTRDIRRDTFPALVNVGLPQNVVRGSAPRAAHTRMFASDGPLIEIMRKLTNFEPPDSARARLKPNVSVKDSITIRSAYGEGGQRSARRERPWRDPVRGGIGDPCALFSHYADCKRFYFVDRPDAGSVPFVDHLHGGLTLHRALRGRGRRYGRLKRALGARQRQLLFNLLSADMLEIEEAG